MKRVTWDDRGEGHVFNGIYDDVDHGGLSGYYGYSNGNGFGDGLNTHAQIHGDGDHTYGDGHGDGGDGQY